MKHRGLLAFTLALLAGCAHPTFLVTEGEEPVLAWSALSNQAIRQTPRIQPIQQAARANALVHLSMGEALARAREEGLGEAFERSATSHAAARAMRRLYPERAAEWERRAAVSGETGKALGEASADAVFARAGKTWFLERPDQFRPDPTGIDWKEQFRALQLLQREVTPERLAQARKWAHDPVPAAWGEVALGLLRTHRRDALSSVRLLGLLHATIDDATTAYLDAQNAYRIPRPSEWARTRGFSFSSALSTPRQPSFPSGHAALSQAAAIVLSDAFPSEAGRLQALADEATRSRLDAGVHFPIDSSEGQALGERVARFALRQEKGALTRPGED
ncbi:MAG: phosphatase PAP2 family protein [Bacteroidota bacterium]